MKSRFLLGTLVLWCVLRGTAPAEEAPISAPRAGEAYATDLWGELVEAPARNRNSVTALNLGVYGIPNGPAERELLPFGALFAWRNMEGGKTRFRGVFSGLYNDVRYNTTPAFLGGAEAVFTFENLTIPFGRPEYIEGRSIVSEELQWHYLRGGMGLGYRAALPPGHQDNAVELALTYEPGVLLFFRGGETAPSFQMPQSTYEGRVHLRARADKIERNILELPHQGLAAGMDLLYGHRADWRDWGGPVFGIQDGGAHKEWFAASVYAVAAGGLPFVEDERHRLIASAYGGIGVGLDRFSAFRLGGGPGGGEWEALSRPVLPGAAFEEFFPRHYGILNLEYRYQVLYFLYTHLRGSFAWVERPRFNASGVAVMQTDSMPSVTASVTSGFVWHSQLELGTTYNFGLLRNNSGKPGYGGQAILLSWSKEF